MIWSLILRAVKTHSTIDVLDQSMLTAVKIDDEIINTQQAHAYHNWESRKTGGAWKRKEIQRAVALENHKNNKNSHKCLDIFWNLLNDLCEFRWKQSTKKTVFAPRVWGGGHRPGFNFRVVEMTRKKYRGYSSCPWSGSRCANRRATGPPEPF